MRILSYAPGVGPCWSCRDCASTTTASCRSPTCSISWPAFVDGYDYTVLCAHGTTGDDGEPKIVVETVDQVDGDYEAETGWEPAMTELTPRNVPELVHADGGTLVAAGCGAGRQALARAFLDAGFDAYIGMTELSRMPTPSRRCCSWSDSSTSRTSRWPRTGPGALSYTDAEAVEHAAALDASFPYGTGSFRYWTR